MASDSRRLPEEIPAPAGRRKVLVTIVGTLVCAVLVNLLASVALTGYTTNGGYWLIHSKWTLLNTMAQPVDLLILGDSSCNQGLRPDVFKRRLGATSVNLCTNANVLVVNDAWMLDTYIQRFGPPKRVVIMHVYDAWHRSIDKVFRGPLLAKIPLPWGFWQRMEPRVDIDWADMRDIFVVRYLPLYSDNKTLASWILSPSTAFETQFQMDTQGYVARPRPYASEVRRDVRRHLHFVRGHRFQMSKANHAALDRIRLLAETYDFDVYLVTAPMAITLWSDPKLRQYYGSVRETLHDLAAQSPKMHIVFENPVTFPPTRMESADHVIHAAAEELSNRVADALITPGTDRL